MLGSNVYMDKKNEKKLNNPLLKTFLNHFYNKLKNKSITSKHYHLQHLTSRANT